ncbi:hypothetical protein ACJZ2D_002579 [Fusarium nematophilum]
MIEMKHSSYSDSDENEPSLPSLQLSSLTEALLARPGLGTPQRPTAVTRDDEMAGDNSNAGQARRLSRISNLVRLPSSQHRTAASLRTDDGLNDDGACNTATTSLQLPPKTQPKRGIPAPFSTELPSLDRHNNSSNAAGHEHQADVTPATDSEGFPGDSKHTPESSPDDLDLVPRSSRRDTGRTEADRGHNPSTTSTTHTRLSTRSKNESQETSASARSYESVKQCPPRHRKAAKESLLSDRDKITSRKDATPGTDKPQSHAVRGASSTWEGHHQAHVIPAPRPSADVPSTANASAAASVKRRVTVPEKRRAARCFMVNGQPYTVTRKLGKGGSGRVYEVMTVTNQQAAFKRIPLNNLDDRSKSQIKNEVALLKSLAEVERVVQIWDWAVDEAKNFIYIVMELGQIDLDTIIKEHYQRNSKFDFGFVGYYWLEILRCVAGIHGVDVVHSDLKPANFVLTRSMLKLVDFGIANAIADDTVNIYQDHQAGTPNYMAPETLKALSMPPGQQGVSRSFRFGKPSDMWSLGCILYLMVYGQQPFGHIQGLAPKFMAICDPGHTIKYSAEGLGDVNVPPSFIRTMKACLSRDPSRRPTVNSLLQRVDGLLEPEGRAGNVVYITPQKMEGLLSNALRQAGTWASPAEIKSWADEVTHKLEKENQGGLEG